MRLAKILFALLVPCILGGQTPASSGPQDLGPQGPEAEPNREQANREEIWLVPSSAPGHPAHAVLFRPPGNGPLHPAVIAHATTQNALRRAQMPQPEYRALAAFLVARGFAVLVPERLGHGATGGAYLGDQHGRDGAEY